MGANNIIQDASTTLSMTATKKTHPKVYICTDCGGDAFVSWANSTKKDTLCFGVILKPGERICLPCGKKRGVGFFK